MWGAGSARLDQTLSGLSDAEMLPLAAAFVVTALAALSVNGRSPSLRDAIAEASGRSPVLGAFAAMLLAILRLVAAMVLGLVMSGFWFPVMLVATGGVWI